MIEPPLTPVANVAEPTRASDMNHGPEALPRPDFTANSSGRRVLTTAFVVVDVDVDVDVDVVVLVDELVDVVVDVLVDEDEDVLVDDDVDVLVLDVVDVVVLVHELDS